MLKNLSPIFLVVIFSFLFKLIIIFLYDLTFFSDDAIYASLARFWIEGKFSLVFHPTWPPLFPFLSAFLYLIFKNWEISLRLVSAITGSLVLIPIYFLIRQFLPKVLSILFVAIISFIQPLLYISIFPLSDALALSLIISGLISFYFGIRDSKLIVLSGFLFGLAYLTRSEGMMFFGLSLLFLIFYEVFYLIKKGNLNLKRLLIIPTFIFVFALTIIPYLIAMSLKFNEFLPSAKFNAQIQQDHAFALNSEQTTWSQEVVSVKSPNYNSTYFRNGQDYLLDNFTNFNKLFIGKLQTWQMRFLQFFPWWSTILIIFGFFIILRKDKASWQNLYLIFILGFSLPVTIYITPIEDIRYLAWAQIILLYFYILGGLSLLDLFSHFKLSKFVRHLSLFTLVLSLIFFPSFSFGNVLNPKLFAQELTDRHFRKEFLDACKLIGNSSKNPKLMVRREAFEFYCKGETIYLPQAPLEVVLAYGEKHNADFLIAWDVELEKDENLKVLLENNFNHPKLKKVYQINSRNMKIIIYQLLNAKP